MKNNNIFSYLVELNQFIYISITIAGVLLLQLSVKAQILFENSDFEIGNNCDLEDCEDTDISCIPDWWNYYYPTEADEFAWVYYDDYLLCSTASLESCGGERGMKIYVSTSYEPLAPTTSNPFLGLNKFGAYEIHFQLNIIDNDCPSAIVEVYVDENEFDQTPNSDEFIADVTGTFNNNQCYDVKIGITDPVKVEKLTSKEYLIFKIRGTCQSTPPAIITVDAVIDNVEACNLLNIETSTFECGMLCLDLSTECLTTCDEIRYDDPELDDCYMLVEWYPNDNYNSEEIIEECYFAYIGSGRCCITPPEPGFYYPKVLVQYLINGESSGAEYNLEVDYQDCSTVVVNSTTTWNSSNVSEFARFDLITVQSGVTLTIAADLTLNFCEEGQLVINPGGRVILNGILTADCENGWFGVQVQGNSSTNQFPQSGVYSQGRLFCNPGSRIELAYTAVRLFGPDYEDTGGMIYADGCTFINNRCGIYFAPFNNYFVNPGKPRNYFSSIRNCVFDIVEERPMPAPFIYHIAMYKVNGIFISGTSFGNHRHIEDASDPRPYGIGIRAIDSGFNVGSTAENIEDEPCLDPCINPSKFFGLGNGISTNRVGRNRPFQVFDAEFSNCYFGIVNDGVSGCLIVSNNFEMGAVKNLIGDEDQVGISLSGYLAGLTVEENQFFHSDDEITENSLGIVVNQIGEMDNVIRKNKFIQITVGNEAFGLNADIDPTAHQGLHYLCNENTAVQLNDFYFPDDVTVEDYIRDWQGLIDEDEVLAAGNTFSETGDPDDGDFANHGEWTVSYFYDDNEQSQTPEDYTGIGALVPSDPNNCAVIFCLNPCLTLEGFEEEIDAFYTNTEDFDEAIDEEDFELAAYYRMKLDSNIFNILGYIQYDTSAFERDTLRAWFHRAGSIAGDLLLAADYYDTGEFMRMNRTIDSIPAWHDLTPGQAFDLNRLKYVFGILSVRSVFSLTSTDIDSLTLYSKEIGAAASLARGTLAILDTLFTPRYYIPGEVNPRSDNYTTSPLSGLTKIKVYPNPLKDILTVEVPVNFGPGLTMEFIDINGKVMSELKLNPGHNEVEIRNIIDNHLGIVIYRISSEDGIIDFGKLINLR